MQVQSIKKVVVDEGGGEGGGWRVQNRGTVGKNWVKRVTGMNEIDRTIYQERKNVTKDEKSVDYREYKRFRETANVQPTLLY